MKNIRILVTTSRGCEEALSAEIIQLCSSQNHVLAKPPKIQAAGVLLEGTPETIALLNFGLATASRVLILITDGEARSEDDVYRIARSVDWTRWFDVMRTFSIRTDCRDSFARNSMFISQRIKDAVVDRFRSRFGERPSVAPHAPDIPIVARLLGRELSLAIDTSGEPLSAHGYRVRSGGAPLRENLAAAMLHYLGWAKVAHEIHKPVPKPVLLERVAQGSGDLRRIPAQITLPAHLFDPMCGTGTLGIEAALMLLNRKPNTRRRKFAFQSLTPFQDDEVELQIRDIRDALKSAEITPSLARGRIKIYARTAGLELSESEQRFPIRLGDVNREALDATRANAREAGVEELIEFSLGSFFNTEAGSSQGILICNPPYGERLGEEEETKTLYKQMGDHFKQVFPGWTAWVLSGNAEALKLVGLRPTRRISLFNGELPCTLAQFILYARTRFALQEKSDNIVGSTCLEETMPLSWNIANSALDAAKDLLNATISKTTVPDFARVDWQNNELLVNINRGGKSEIRFTLQTDASGVRLVETKRDVALLHRPFVGAVETFVDKLMTDAGFKRA